jgi:ADP-heptose:LPS heptosyltransferase
VTVLVLRALGLGDALTGVAALRGVRRAWPGHAVVLAGPEEPGTWLARLGVVDDVLPARALEPLAWHGAGRHVAVGLHGRGPQSHRVLQGTDPARLVAFACPEADHPGPEWDDAEHEVLRWCRLVRGAGGECGPEDLRLVPPVPAAARGRHVVVHPGAAAASRRWRADRWARVAAGLSARGLDVVVTGSAAERELGARVCDGARSEGRGSARFDDVAGTLDLPTLADVVATARLLVSGDTGVAHLATALGTPSVTLFGPTPPSAWGPAIDQELHAVIWHGDPAAPGDPHGVVVDPALDGVTVEEVLAAAEPLLGREPAAPEHLKMSQAGR